VARKKKGKKGRKERKKERKKAIHPLTILYTHPSPTQPPLYNITPTTIQSDPADNKADSNARC